MSSLVNQFPMVAKLNDINQSNTAHRLYPLPNLKIQFTPPQSNTSSPQPNLPLDNSPRYSPSLTIISPARSPTFTSSQYLTNQSFSPRQSPSSPCLRLDKDIKPSHNHVSKLYRNLNPAQALKDHAKSQDSSSIIQYQKNSFVENEKITSKPHLNVNLREWRRDKDYDTTFKDGMKKLLKSQHSSKRAWPNSARINSKTIDSTNRNSRRYSTSIDDQNTVFHISSSTTDRICGLCFHCKKIINPNTTHKCLEEKSMQNHISPRNYEKIHDHDLQVDQQNKNVSGFDFQPIITSYESKLCLVPIQRKLKHKISKSQQLSIFLRTPTLKHNQDVACNKEEDTKLNLGETTTPQILLQHEMQNQGQFPFSRPTKSEYLKKIDIFKPRDNHFQTIDKPSPPKKYIENMKNRTELQESRAKKTMLLKNYRNFIAAEHKFSFRQQLHFPNFKHALRECKDT